MTISNLTGNEIGNKDKVVVLLVVFCSGNIMTTLFGMKSQINRVEILSSKMAVGIMIISRGSNNIGFMTALIARLHTFPPSLNEEESRYSSLRYRKAQSEWNLSVFSVHLSVPQLANVKVKTRVVE